MIPKLLHFSVPDSFADEHSAVIENARRLHPDWTVRIWRDQDPIPGARLSRYLGHARSGAQRADLIRLDAVFNQGGVYIDSDFLLLRSLAELAERYDFFIASEDGYNLTNALFGATPHHPAVDSIVSFLEANEPDWAAPENITTGPLLFGRLLRWREDVNVLPRQTFYPYNWNEKKTEPHRLSYAEHLWAGSWISHTRPRESLLSPKKIKSLIKCGMRPVISSAASTLRKATSLARPRNALPTYQNASYACVDEVIALTAHGQKIILDGHDLSITPDVMLRGTHEWPEEAFVRRTLRGGDWFVDVGANVGTFSILAASLCGPFGRVLAFEPNLRVRNLLSKSATLNWFHDRLKVFGVALGDTEGIKTLSYFPNRLGDAQLDVSEKASEPFKMTGLYLSDLTNVDVGVSQLDTVIPVDVPIKILKIDAEGHESKVLVGGRRLLEKQAFDHIMLEAEPELGTKNWGEIFRSLETLLEFGYEPGGLDDDGLLHRYPSIDLAIRHRRGKTLVFSIPDHATAG